MRNFTKKNVCMRENKQKKIFQIWKVAYIDYFGII